MERQPAPSLIPLANYHSQRDALKALFCGNSKEHILLLRGKTGSGKTSLLLDCQTAVPCGTICIDVELRGGTNSIANILYRSGAQIGWRRLPRFTQKLAELGGTPHIKIERNWLTGINNHINVVLHTENPNDRDFHLAALTEAWFQDMHHIKLPILFIFDTYEDATKDVQGWIRGSMMPYVPQARQVRLVIAGQSVPEERSIAWGHCCKVLDLFGVPEARHWLPIISAMNRRIPVNDPESWLAGVCYVAGGDPKKIREIIETLPKIDPTW